MVDEIAEGARADIVGPDQAQPVEPLLIAEFDAFRHAWAPRSSKLSIAQGGAGDNRGFQGECAAANAAPLEEAPQGGR